LPGATEEANMIAIATSSAAPNPVTPSPKSAGGRLVAVDGRTLPLRQSRLEVDAGGGIARVRLEQRFRNGYAEPLALRYELPLPEDGAVSAFAFRLGDRRIVGEIDRRAAARERYERALVEGRSAALLEQQRGSLFTQEIGNVPPGAEVVAEVVVDQRLRWLEEGRWEWRFPTAVAPRYLGAAGRVADADALHVEVADGALDARVSLCLRVADAPAGALPESPSHALAVTREPLADGETLTIGLRDETGARLDRDVVVRWPAAGGGPAASITVARPGEGHAHAADAFALVTVVPPAPTARRRAVPRDLVLLLDTSGSMDGEPLEQARRVAMALVDGLHEGDSLEMLSFSWRTTRWQLGATAVTLQSKRDALRWLAGLDAGGGTEMHDGVLAALAPLRGDAQRQVVLVSDGLIGFEQEIVRTILERLPAGSRLHTVGVGSSVNRTLTAGAARAGRGVEVICGLGEDPERAARRIVARSEAPVVVDLEISGGALRDRRPERLPDLFAGAPALVALRIDPAGGELVVRGRSTEGLFEQRLRAPAVASGAGAQGIVALYGRESVEDLEMRAAAGEPEGEIDPRIERLGLAFQIATRLTSWVAVSEERSVDPRDPVRRVRIPHELPDGTSAEGLGLRPMAGTAPLAMAACRAMPAPAFPARPPAGFGGAPFPPPAGAMRRPAVPRARGRGIVAGVTRAVSSLFERDGDARTMRVSGRVVARSADGLVVEVTLPVPVAWAPPPLVTVALADGTVTQAELDETRSTRSGALAAGVTVRLALRWSTTPSAPPSAIELGCGPTALVVELGG
jgi:Ca-activated chloride channel family protein